MLNISEIAQVARRPECGAEAVEVRDPDEVVATVGGKTVSIHLDPVDGSRWLATIDDGDPEVVAGVGTVAAVLLAARVLAGLPLPNVPPQPSRTLGLSNRPAPLDTASEVAR